jgi:hypothetical protein
MNPTARGKLSAAESRQTLAAYVRPEFTRQSKKESLMISLARSTALLALAFPLVFASSVEAAGKPGTEADPVAKSDPNAKASAVDAKKVDPEEEAEIKKNIEKLDPTDRKLALAQKFCAIEDENRLGVMGKPVKLMIKDKPVFICCAGCKKAALAEPDKTLAKVEELKKKSAPAK